MTRTRQRFLSDSPVAPPGRKGIAGTLFGCLPKILGFLVVVSLCGITFWIGPAYLPSLGELQSAARPVELEQVEPDQPLKLGVIQEAAYGTKTVAPDSLLADLLQQPVPEANRIIMLWSSVNLLGEEEESAVPLMVVAVEGDAFSATDMDGDIWKCNSQTLKIDDCVFVEWIETAPNDGLAASASAIIEILAREAEEKVVDWASEPPSN